MANSLSSSSLEVAVAAFQEASAVAQSLIDEQRALDELSTMREVSEYLDDECNVQLADDEIEQFVRNHPEWWSSGELNSVGRRHVVLISETVAVVTDYGFEAVVAQFAE